MSSQSIFIRSQQLATAHALSVVVKWIPGNQDIRGDEAAGKLAKKGAIKVASDMFADSRMDMPLIQISTAQ